MELKEIAADMTKIKTLIEVGHDDKFICKLFGIHMVTWQSWLKKHPDFRLAVLEWKKIGVAAVEKKLFERAVGYDYEAEKIFCNKDGNVTRVKTVEHVPPDINAAKFFLTNQAPKKWKDKVEVEHDVTGTLAEAILKARGRAGIEAPKQVAQIEDTETDDEDFLK